MNVLQQVCSHCFTGVSSPPMAELSIPCHVSRGTASLVTMIDEASQVFSCAQ
jgi:hypothetical protein